jgi:peptidoglycan/xylan/chitin deacetylase (PgdA/CDA1 family)
MRHGYKPLRPVVEAFKRGFQHATAIAVIVMPTIAVPAAKDAEAAGSCIAGTVYLTFDTGSQSQAEYIATVLKHHAIKATFFLANEKTVKGDYSLDTTWGPYWKERVAEGHAFGTHTFDHVSVKRDLQDGKMRLKPQFGTAAGQEVTWDAGQYCEELKRVDRRFAELTGHRLDPFWRAPGGKLTPHLKAAGESCGYTHVGWAPAGFSGDELSSEKVSNAVLLDRALNGLRNGDIFMAHLGIWSRKDPWAPSVLEPLIEGLEKKGFCFATLRDRQKLLSGYQGRSR